MNLKDRILIAGHKGMVGSALVRNLLAKGFSNLILAAREQVDFRDSQSVKSFFQAQKPEVVFLAAAKVGGIKANKSFPAEFLYDNLAIQSNVIHQSHLSGVKLLVFLGSSCIYPKVCPQPMKEEYLMTGPLEPTNEGYAIAKIAGLKLAQYYSQQYGMKVLNPMPCNLYGTNDHFDLEKSHVLSALVRRFVDAHDERKDEVTLWGTGTPRREFLHVDDLAEAIIFLTEKYDSPETINVGSGSDISIRELAEMIGQKVGFRGKTTWDSTMPDGMMKKLLDVTKMTKLGFKPKISLSEGVDQMIGDYRRLKSTGEKIK